MLSRRWRNARTDGGAQDHPSITALRPQPATMEHPESWLTGSQFADDRHGREATDNSSRGNGS